VAQIEIGLGAVVGDEHLAVLERRHRARIHVQIRVRLTFSPRLFDAARPNEDTTVTFEAAGWVHVTPEKTFTTNGRLNPWW
jgi:hypothetical protein